MNLRCFRCSTSFIVDLDGEFEVAVHHVVSPCSVVGWR